MFTVYKYFFNVLLESAIRSHCPSKENRTHFSSYCHIHLWSDIRCKISGQLHENRMHAWRVYVWNTSASFKTSCNCWKQWVLLGTINYSFCKLIVVSFVWLSWLTQCWTLNLTFGLLFRIVKCYLINLLNFLYAFNLQTEPFFADVDKKILNLLLHVTAAFYWIYYPDNSYIVPSAVCLQPKAKFSLEEKGILTLSLYCNCQSLEPLRVHASSVP